MGCSSSPHKPISRRPIGRVTLWNRGSAGIKRNQELRNTYLNSQEQNLDSTSTGCVGKKGPKMSQKLTLARYLELRGETKALTRIEALAFGVPYPLIAGWPSIYGGAEISAEMLRSIELCIENAKPSRVKCVARAIKRIRSEFSLKDCDEAQSTLAMAGGASKSFYGFSMKRARRFSVRHPRVLP